MKLRIGISACLLGEQVRYNGGHKRDRYIVDTLANYVDWVPVCPEVEIGLGVPRPTIHLEKHGDNPEILLIEPSTGRDLTGAMNNFADTWLAGAGDLHGFILQRGSPSCGPKAKVWKNEIPADRAPGLFAAKTLELGIPVMDEGMLRDPGLREHFFDQAMLWRRWHEHLQSGAHIGNFQANNKLTLMSHDPQGAKELGKLAADGDEEGYANVLPQVLAKRATRGKHANVLQHIQGYLKDSLDADDKQELVDVIRDYQEGLHPLLVPLTLLRHHMRKHSVPGWLLQQTYIEPYPKEWMLRGHI